MVLACASCEQGEEAQVYAKLTPKTLFDGNAKAELLGIPPKVKTTALEFNKETQEITFQLQTDKASPAGKHNMYCRVTIMQNGEPIVSSVGSVQLQIDKPLPPPPNAKPAPPKPKAVAKAPPKPAPKPNAPKPKPLTRLQKLRLAAKQRAEERAAKAVQGGEE